jgi:hypothetical protein
MLWVGCGKKGPPLPPLVKIPVAPPGFTAERRGATVDLQFTVPAANTDGTRPANIERVDVYGMTGPRVASAAELLRRGRLIQSVPVKKPRNPNDTIDLDDPDDELDPLEGNGHDQGAIVHVEDTLGPETSRSDTGRRSTPAPSVAASVDFVRPLAAPSIFNVASRNYVTVGISTGGRKGTPSPLVCVSLAPLPASSSVPVITYDEKAITVTWTPPPVGEIQSAPTKDLLPARPIGLLAPTYSYNVYAVPPGQTAETERPVEERLTKTPVAEPQYSDNRVQWGMERCYVVRTVETVGDLRLESEPSPAGCRKLVDTFPPAAPKGLTAVASENAISLIWQPNSEADLAGYVVIRGTPPGGATQQLTKTPIRSTTYDDTGQPGATYVYVVKALDTSGNVSAASNMVEEAGR